MTSGSPLPSRLVVFWERGGGMAEVLPFPSSLLPMHTFQSFTVHEDAGPALLPVETSKCRTQWFLKLGVL